MRRAFAMGLAVWLVSASLLALSFQASRAQDGVILGEAPVLQSGSTVYAAGDDIVQAASVPGVDTSSRASSAAFFYAYYNGDPAIVWTGSHASCNAGTTASAFKSAELDRIAYYRAMAGVPSNIGLSASAITGNQQAALMFSRNNMLSHTPASNWLCYTAAGAQSAAASNIVLGAHGTYAIDAYMRDPGPGNTAVGHRRWLLYPQTQAFGVGDVPSMSGYAAANSVTAWDTHADDPRPTTRDGFVAWPPAGYVPYQVVFARWSFSYPNANFISATVTVTSDGADVPLIVDSSSVEGYGENTVVFRPYGWGDGTIWPNPGTDKTYQVKISNVLIGGQSQTFTYDVTVFDTAASPPVATSTTTPTRTMTRTATPTKTATATITPTGLAATQPATSTPTIIPGGFGSGYLFQTTANLNMRTGPNTSYSSAGVLPSGTVGVVTGAPIFASGFTWYPITVDGYGSGWAAGEYFAHVTPTATATATSTASKTPTPPPPTATPTATSTLPPATATQTFTRTPDAPPTATRIPGGYLPGDIVRTTATVNFRTGPGTSYSVIATVSSNTQATITGSPINGNGYTWYPMTIPGVGSGWIASNYITMVAMVNPEPTIPPTAVGGYELGVTVYTTANLNIRTGAGTGYSSIGVAPKGTSAIITGQAVKVGSVYWVPLDAFGTGSGWASGSYLSFSPTVSAPAFPTASDPEDEHPEDDPTATPTLQVSAPPRVPTQVAAAADGTEELIDIEEATEETGATPDIVEAPTSAEESPADVIEIDGDTETPAERVEIAADEEIPVDGVDTDDASEEIAVAAEASEAIDQEPVADSEPTWLPIERVQRSTDSQPGQLLVDDKLDTTWTANGVGQPLAMFVLDLGQETTFSQITWHTDSPDQGGTLYLAISSDGENWTDLDPTLVTTNDEGWQVLDTDSSATYVRFVFINDSGSDWLGGIDEVRIMP